MVTLYKRATPAQKRILRAVEGAVLNVQDAHSEPRNHRMARSIAKRATGTLTANWPDVLALRASRAARPHPATTGGKASQFVKAPRGAVRTSHGRTPLLLLIRELSKELRYLKKENPEKAEAFIEVLRIIDRLRTQRQ